jgi:hypothetical protein
MLRREVVADDLARRVVAFNSHLWPPALECDDVAWFESCGVHAVFSVRIDSRGRGLAARARRLRRLARFQWARVGVMGLRRVAVDPLHGLVDRHRVAVVVGQHEAVIALGGRERGIRSDDRLTRGPVREPKSMWTCGFSHAFVGLNLYRDSIGSLWTADLDLV